VTAPKVGTGPPGTRARPRPANGTITSFIDQVIEPTPPGPRSKATTTRSSNRARRPVAPHVHACYVPECERPGECVDDFGRRMCLLHWKRLRRWQRGIRPRIDFAAPAFTPRQGCIVPNCGRRHEAKGYCHLHWWRWRNGKPLDPPATPRSERHRGRGCQVPGCDNKNYARGLCRRHHVAWKRWGTVNGAAVEYLPLDSSLLTN
jgi:hypothetical protein